MYNFFGKNSVDLPKSSYSTQKNGNLDGFSPKKWYLLYFIIFLVCDLLVDLVY